VDIVIITQYVGNNLENLLKIKYFQLSDFFKLINITYPLIMKNKSTPVTPYLPIISPKCVFLVK
jgi:hypothetical protein